MGGGAGHRRGAYLEFQRSLTDHDNARAVCLKELGGNAHKTSVQQKAVNAHGPEVVTRSRSLLGRHH